MPLNVAAAVPLANMVTGWSRPRRFGQRLEGRRQQVGVPIGLVNSPLSARVLPNVFQVALCGGESRYSAMRAAELALECARV